MGNRPAIFSGPQRKKGSLHVRPVIDSSRSPGAALDRDPAARGAVEVVLSYPGFHALQFHRLAHWLHRSETPLLPRLISHLSRFLTGIEIHPGATIGDGLFIDHGMGVVIGETAELGQNCHLYQGVTLGGTSTPARQAAPNAREQHVTVGANASVIGAVNVGDNVRIGAGSVVVTNEPPNATVVGVPGHIVAFQHPVDSTIERLPDPEWDRIEQLERRIRELEDRVEELSRQPAVAD